jgi:hypothetical protein
MDWTPEEVALAVNSYLNMLQLEMAGQTYNKAAARRALHQQIPARSEPAIEFKHCNISAALIELGYPPIRGYQPRDNFQRRALFEELTRQIAIRPELEITAQRAVELPAVVPQSARFEGAQIGPPPLQAKVRQVDAYRPPPVAHRDYLAREARNRSLGLAGEEFVVLFERWRLIHGGKEHLADRIEHTAKVRGDGAGYDVLSFETSGQERFIEVKTTSYAKETPFFISSGELAFANHHDSMFHLYRVFEFRRNPKLFDLQGRLDRHCQLDPVSFRASFG